MGILHEDYQSDLLDSWQDGTMPMGIGIDCDLDNHLRFKEGQFNITLGHDNVGKTFFEVWYLTILAIKTGYEFTIYCTENKVWSIKSKIISFYSNKDIRKLDKKEYYNARNWMSHHFKFIDTSRNYTIPELLDVCSKQQHTKAFLFDPYNSINRMKGYDAHTYDYEMASLVRLFCNQNNQTININMHSISESQRFTHKDGDFKGLQSPPIKAHAEGGGKWANRCDDFKVIHRYFKVGYRFKTMVSIDKVKETETGGDRTLITDPLFFDCDLTDGYGFSINGKNPLLMHDVKPMEKPYNVKEGFPNINEDEQAPF